MADKVQSVIDTILGEALAGDYQDMVGIASVIDNRAKATGVSHKDVVAAPRQFDAYGKRLPPGVSKHRNMAKRALDQVQTLGPVHNATFYATPSAVKNLPSGLAPVTETKGHRYFADPQNRAIRTAQGYKRPDPAAVQMASMAPDAVPTPTSRPTGLLGPVDVAGNATGTLYDVTPSASTISATARAGASRLSGITPSGFATYGPDVDLEDRALSGVIGLQDYNPGARRSVTPTSGIIGDVQRAVTRSFGPGYGVGVVSGQEPVGLAAIGSPRNHPPGLAIDFDVVSMNPDVTGVPAGQRVDITQAEFADAVREMTNSLATQGHGIGLDPSGRIGGYMNKSGQSPGRVHAGGPGIGWGGIDVGQLAEARARGAFETPDEGPTPTANPGPNMPARSLLDPRSFSAPVERSMLGGSPASILGDISMPSQQPSFAETVNAAREVTSNFPGRPAPDISGMPAATVDRGMPGRSQVTPSVDPSVSQSAFDQTAFNSMTPAISMPGALPSFSAVVPPDMTDIETRPVPAPAMPTAAPVAPPQAVPAAFPPAPAPPAQSVSRPAQSMAAQAPRSATGQDVWSGQAMSGIATNGNQMTRNPDGTVSMTSSKYGYTETMNPDGSYHSTTAPGLFGLDQAVNSMFGAIEGPLGGKGVRSAQSRAPSNQDMGSRLGRGAQSAAGAVAGGMIGGLLGPVGGMLGSYLGAQLAQGKNPISGLLSRQITPQQSFQRGFTPGLGFPDAPEGNRSQGGLTSFGEAASRGDFGSQAQSAANNPGGGLY